MENKNYNTDSRDSEKGFRIGGRSRNSQAIIGGFIIIIGILILLRRLGLPIPHWLYSWEMILIGVGVVMGVKSGFRDISWIIPIIIGTIFLSGDIFPHLHFGNLIWPVGIIVIGAIFIVKGNKRRNRGNSCFYPNDNGGTGAPPTGQDETFVSGFKRMDEPGGESGTTGQAMPGANAGMATSTDDEIECVAVFGGVKRSVVSKNFRGGEIVAVFGGAEIDLTHADINGVVKLEATNVLGGTKLIVPPTWDVQSEMVAIFGGVEDKRRIQPERINQNKRLVLYGTAFLGGLEIKSF